MAMLNDLGLANARLALAPSTGAMRFARPISAHLHIQSSFQASAATIT
jgi:hypothetical protein